MVDASGERSGNAEDPAERASIGRYLASQRRLRGISLDELAASTKIPRRNLERLESGVFDGEADGFVRGFVRTVAEELGLDPHETVMRLAKEPSGDEEEARRRRLRAIVLGIAMTALLLALFGWGVRLATRWLAPPPVDSMDHVYRHDAVRSLAEERESGAGGAGGPDAAERPAPTDPAPAGDPPGP